MKSLLRDRFAVGLVASLIALVGLAGLFFPVSLDVYDHWGVQIQCGTGFVTELDQAEVQDDYSSGQGLPQGGAQFRRTTDDCTQSVWLRRAWAAPVLLAGLVMMTFLATDRWWRT